MIFLFVSAISFLCMVAAMAYQIRSLQKRMAVLEARLGISEALKP